MTIKEINTDCLEGKLLMTALVILTISKEINVGGKIVKGTKKGPDEMLDLLIMKTKE